MNRKLVFIATLLTIVINSQAQNLQNKLDSATYANGYQMGSYFQQSQISVNIEALVTGILDGYKMQKPQVEMDKINELSQQFNMYLQQTMQERQNAEVQNNKKIGQSVMEANRKNSNIKETASGLQYQVLQAGKKGAAKPTATDRVKVHYKGYLHNGNVFDSSIDRGEPITFALNQVIKGWTEGLQLMTVGSKYKFWIPSDLAYGDRAMGNSIPAGSMLIFEVELLDINPQ